MEKSRFGPQKFYFYFKQNYKQIYLHFLFVHRAGKINFINFVYYNSQTRPPLNFFIVRSVGFIEISLPNNFNSSSFK